MNVRQQLHSLRQTLKAAEDKVATQVSEDVATAARNQNAVSDHLIDVVLELHRQGKSERAIIVSRASTSIRRKASANEALAVSLAAYEEAVGIPLAGPNVKRLTGQVTDMVGTEMHEPVTDTIDEF